jgi:hypothetical protein
MSKKTDKVYIESLEKDYAEVVRQRDTATRALDRISGMKRLEDQVKEQAKRQEKLDGIRAGLIPVEALRALVTERTYFKTGAEFVLSFAARPDADNAIENAIKEALSVPVFARGGYIGPKTSIALTDMQTYGTSLGPKTSGGYIIPAADIRAHGQALLNEVNRRNAIKTGLFRADEIA